VRARFRGVRGSVPWASAESIRFGTNTPCIELRDRRNDGLLVLDAGTGLVGLGDDLGEAPGRLSLLLTHYHWDHLNGLPFFQPIFNPGWDIGLWGPAFDTGPGAIQRVFRPPYFTMSYGDLPSAPTFHEIAAGHSNVAGFDVRALPLSHPGGAFAYRIRGESGDFVYATDHEFGTPTADDALAAFARGAAHVVVDAHFTPDEAPAARGWGHSTWQQAAEFGRAVDAGRLWLFHHKPGRRDDEIDEIVERARGIFPRIDAAAEGIIIEL
jgi:phosphoribosyl 1,2-cyclic phosphodiesterase